jgi:hypothetical protein
LGKVLLAAAVLAVLAVVLRPVGPAIVRWLWSRTGQLFAGASITVLAVGLVVLGFLRPRLFGEDFQNFDGTVARSYDEQILARLSWFVTVPAFVLMLAGIAILAIRRWSVGLWALAAPLLLIFPVYGLHARNSTRLMWWSRRYLPSVIPLVLMLAAVALTALAFLVAAEVSRRRPGLARVTRAGGAALALLGTVALTVVFAGQSLPLRSHSEFGGSFDVSERVAASAGGQQGLFLWQRSPACCLYAQSLFGGALWLERNQISALLPDDQHQVAGYLANFRQAFPGQPEFVIWHGQGAPALPGVRFEPVQRVRTALSYWEETLTRRPDKATSVPLDFVVYRVLA